MTMYRKCYRGLVHLAGDGTAKNVGYHLQCQDDALEHAPTKPLTVRRFKKGAITCMFCAAGIKIPDDDDV